MAGGGWSGWLFAMMLVWWSGFGLWMLTQPPETWDWFECLAYAFPVGAGVVVIGALLLDVVHQPWTPQAVLTPLALIGMGTPAIRGWLTHRRLDVSARHAPEQHRVGAIGLLRGELSGRWSRWAVAIIATEAVLLLLTIAVQQRFLDWDAWAIWGFKAKAFFVDQGVHPYLQRADAYGYSWPARPCFSAIFQAVIYGCMGRVDEAGARLIHWCWYAAVLMLCCHVLRQVWGWRRAVGWTAMIATVPVLTYHATAGLGSMVLGSYLFAVLVALGRWAHQRRLPVLLGAGGLLGCVWLIRDEGMMLGSLGVAVACLAVATAIPWRQRLMAAGVLLVIAGVVYGLWGRVLGAHDVWDLRSSWTWSSVLPQMAKHLRDLPVILRLVWRELMAPDAQALATPLERWVGVAFFWPVALWGAVRCLASRTALPLGRGCAWMTVGSLCIYVGGFLAFPYTDVIEMGQNWLSALDRHLVCLIPFAVCALACAVECRVAGER